METKLHKGPFRGDQFKYSKGQKTCQIELSTQK